jgi:hypothetical protein
MGQPLSPFCIYTIRHSERLDEVYRAGGSNEFEENTTWKTGRQLLLEAKDRGMRVPVVFASTDVTDKLIYYAMLSRVEVDHENATTSYAFTDLTPIEGDHPLSSLKLRSNRRPLSDKFIRPYAICLTPSFIAT